MKIPRKRLIAYLIAGAILTIISFIVSFIVAGDSGSDNDPMVNVAILVLGIPLLILEYGGMIINWKRVLKGIIAPIPILSMMIESFKGMFYMAKGLVVIAKKQDYLIIGDVVETNAAPYPPQQYPPYPPQAPQYPTQTYPPQQNGVSPASQSPYTNMQYPQSSYPTNANGQYRPGDNMNGK